MGFRIGIMGPPNSGKSYSRRTIPDGENVLVIAASFKTTYLTTTEGKPVKPLNIITKAASGWQAHKEFYKVSSETAIIRHLTDKISRGKFRRENLPGNMVVVRNVGDLSFWLYFIDKHMPWIHTIVIPDFTHYISEAISRRDFIERKAGGDAYQRFWELAADALRGFILASDNIRHETIVVTEYHAEYDEIKEQYCVFTSAGKMLTEKFLPTSYYDIMFCTHTVIDETSTAQEIKDFKFVTRPTKQYRDARALGLFDELYIDNDLEAILGKVREHLGLEKPQYNESAATA
jgi:hypothetical protein